MVIIGNLISVCSQRIRLPVDPPPPTHTSRDEQPSDGTIRALICQVSSGGGRVCALAANTPWTLGIRTHSGTSVGSGRTVKEMLVLCPVNVFEVKFTVG